MKLLPTKYRPHLRRLCALLLGAWYGAFSSGGLLVFLDWALPLAKSVANPNFPCAHHACGCQTKEECRSRCCCSSENLAPTHHLHFKNARSDQAPLKTPVSFLVDSRCKGNFPGHGPGSGPKAPEHIFESPWRVPSAPEPGLFLSPRFSALDSACPSPPEKVPI